MLCIRRYGASAAVATSVVTFHFIVADDSSHFKTSTDGALPTAVIQAQSVAPAAFPQSSKPTSATYAVKNEADLFYVHHLSKRRVFINGSIDDMLGKV